MRILCLTSRLPWPPDRGDRLRAFQVLRTLSAEHELTLLSFVESPEQLRRAATLRDVCREIRTVERGRTASAATALIQAWRRQPLQTLYYRSAAMRRLVNDALVHGDFDAAYVHLFRMAPYLQRGELPFIVLDLTDVMSGEIRRSLHHRGLGWRLVYSLEWRRIARYEAKVASDADETWLVSAIERDALAERSPTADLRVVPNGVDLDGFRPLAGQEQPGTIVFTGHMGVPHNVDAAVWLVESILPTVRRERPEVRLRIVGADPVARVQRLHRPPAVEVTGFVPDLNGELNRAAVFVAPLRFSAGVQNKVLEALAAGRPVVATGPVGAALGAEAGRDLLVADDAAGIAACTLRLLGDAALRRRLGAAARELVHRGFDWKVVAERMRAVAERVGRRPSPEEA